MKPQRINLYYTLLVILISPFLSAAQFNVSTPAGIQAALNTADGNGEDDIVNIDAGVYSIDSTLLYNSFEDKSLTIQGTGGDVILEGQNTRILYLYTHTANAPITMKNLIFTNGGVVEDNGGCGFVRSQFADITLDGLQFSGCRSTSLFFSSNGGGLYARIESGGELLIRNSSFDDNFAKGIGGGLQAMGGVGTRMTLVNNVFTNNEATAAGGGAHINMTGGTLTVTNNSFTGNSASSGTGYGGGALYAVLYLDINTAHLYNNIFWGNTAENPTGEDFYIEDDPNVNAIGATLNVFNNVYTDFEYQDGDHLSQADNLNADPLLTPGLRLQMGSPAIDTGHSAAPSLPAKDFEGEDRDANPDIGADEFLDQCPVDPDKSEPGQCGCGVADTDTDGDGTADCNDGCPADPDKTAAGICGCGVADTDTDGDGTADCNDGCPADPDKAAAGICGCGVADTDTDGDGTADCEETATVISGGGGGSGCRLHSSRHEPVTFIQDLWGMLVSSGGLILWQIFRSARHRRGHLPRSKESSC